MKQFLSQAAIEKLWIDKVTALVPRLKGGADARILTSGDLAEDIGLDSLDIFELAAHFHGMFRLMEGSMDQYLLQYTRAEEWIQAIFQGANDFSRSMTFYSSGSTGQPRACEHKKEDLLQEVETWMELLNFSETLWGWVSPTHIYGFLFTALLPDQLNLKVTDARNLHLALLLREAKEGDWLIGFPDLYRNLIRAQVTFPVGLRAISSTAPLQDQLARQMREQGLELIEIYGSSESGGIAYRRGPESHYHLLPFWTRESDRLRRKSPSGEPGRAMQPNDLLIWKDEQTFSIQGRRDEGVQVGGHNVFPSLIAKKIGEIEGVKDCWVRIMKAEEGSRLKCWIRPEAEMKDWKGLERACYLWIDEHLSPPERPRHITIGDHPPANPMGKISDWSIHSSHIFSPDP